MRRAIFGGLGLPDYHDDLLLVRMRPAPELAGRLTQAARARAAGEAEAVPLPDDVLSAEGLAALEYYNRAGLLRGIVPLARPAPGRPGADLMAAGSATAALYAAIATDRRRSSAAAIERGVAFVQLDSAADGDRLRAALADDPHVERVSRVPVRYLTTAKRPSRRKPSPEGAAAIPPATGRLPWNLEIIGWEEAVGRPGYREPEAIKVAVLDTGVDEHHPDLEGRMGPYTWYPDGPASAGRDIVGHGTHVTGIIGARRHPGYPIAGLCRCDLRNWKIFDDVARLFETERGYAYTVNPRYYLRALLDCLDEGVNVINLSIGGPGAPSAEEQLAFDALMDAETVIVAAMGNERAFGSPTSYPAAIPGVVAVAATRPDDRIANFSSRGGHVALAAPGTAIWSTLPTYPGNTGYDVRIGPDGRPVQGKPQWRETDYDAWDGTSMATPHVTGAVAMLLGNMGPLTMEEVRDRLVRSAAPVPWAEALPDPDYGAGRLDLAALLAEPAMV